MELDLHGIRHYQVDYTVENFILCNQEKLPLKIVCGNSQKMIDLTNEVINRIKCSDVSMDRYGIIVIRKI